MTEPSNQTNTGTEPQFYIVRLYVKDISFEAPNSPAVFTQNWQPELDIQVESSTNPLEDDHYEVVLNITVTAKQGDKTGFLCEIQQAGIFVVKGFNEERKGFTLGAFCPNTLFPFAREAIANLVVKGGFPHLLLAPINFDGLYEDRLKQLDASNTAESGQSASQ